MKNILILIFSISIISGCSRFKTKKTEFYKNGKLVNTFIGKGVFDNNEYSGNYKIWTGNGWEYFVYNCEKCEVKETIIGN